MAETIKIWQNNNFNAKIWAPPAQNPDSDELNEVMHIHELTPYGMLLVSLGLCTGIVLHTYSQYHHVDLREVEFKLQYNRKFKEDCEDCENIDTYDESIEFQIFLKGDLTSEKKRSFLQSQNNAQYIKCLKKVLEQILS